MNKPIIEVQNISKSYIIGHRLGYKTLRDSVSGLFSRALKPNKDKINATKEEFWALRDINFTIDQGERIGIIGRNGAGKSTLLKILSQITSPTTGQVTLRGRVASLLEVGTGFHPELSGRENVFLNGTILGMKQSEIRSKFDEIVGFAEIEQFIDTPVKRYSSGMYVRLAFAVAAHLEPEILIVDEVLAVGDTKFQKKCLGKMEEVGKDGRTVIFVSHNMSAINQLCTKTILIERGRLVEFGITSDVVSKFISEDTINVNQVHFTEKTFRHGDGEYLFDYIKLHNGQGQETNKFSIGQDIILTIKFHPIRRAFQGGLRLGVDIITSDGLSLANCIDADSGFSANDFQDVSEITIKYTDVRLYPGTYTFGLWIGPENASATYDHIQSAISFEIIDGGRLTTRSLPRHNGLLFLTPQWSGRMISSQ